MAELVLGYGEGNSSTPTDPMLGNFSDATGDVPQTGGDGVAASVLRAGGGGGCGVEGLDLRLQDYNNEKSGLEIWREGGHCMKKETYKQPWTQRRRVGPGLPPGPIAPPLARWRGAGT